MAIIASKDGSPSERLAVAYQQLTASASNLNTASDELGKSINLFDSALKKLNVGVATWVEVNSWEDSNGDYTAHYLGYAKVGGRWGIALSIGKGNSRWPEEAQSEEWLFNEAPRTLRAEAVDKLPELVEKLVTTADDTTKKIKEKTDRARELAATITTLAAATSSRK